MSNFTPVEVPGYQRNSLGGYEALPAIDPDLVGEAFDTGDNFIDGIDFGGGGVPEIPGSSSALDFLFGTKDGKQTGQLGNILEGVAGIGEFFAAGDLLDLQRDNLNFQKDAFNKNYANSLITTNNEIDRQNYIANNLGYTPGVANQQQNVGQPTQPATPFTPLPNPNQQAS